MAADVVVVGGGLVGLASALALVERAPGLRLTLFEKEPRLASHQSGHNSGVVHSGLYYAPGSLKASLCRQGRAELEAFCEEHDIPFRRCGKLVVAVDESELAGLAELQRRGAENGIQGLAELDEAGLRELEPHARGVRALHVPETAVVDFRLVAGAGLQADRVAALAGVDVGVRVVPFRGAYWKLRGRAADLVRGLIYPVPDPRFPFLGVHFTR